MTTYLLSQERRGCRVHAAWWTPDGEESAAVALLPDRRTASRLAASLAVLSDVVWDQSVAGAGPLLPLSPILADLVAGEVPSPPPAGALPAGRGPEGGDPTSPARLRARVAGGEARTIGTVVATLSPEEASAVRSEVGAELEAASVPITTPLGPADRRWQYFRRISPAALLARWAEAGDGSQDAFLAWATGRPLRLVTGPGEEVATRVADLGGGIEVRVTPVLAGDDPALRMDLQVDGEIRAHLDIDPVDEHDHAGSLLAEIREHLAPDYLADALLQAEAVRHPAPGPEELAVFDRLVARLAALPPGDGDRAAG